jgi:P pilus assembly chaperone PapD
MARETSMKQDKRSGTFWRLLAAIILLVGAAGQAAASVMVAPTVVFLSEHQRTGRIIVQNPSDETTEVTIRFSFGLPTSDSLGNIYVPLSDSNVTDPRSAMDWLQAFPRKVIIPPGGSQTVRLIARPPKDLADGEYWARIVVSSREGEAAVPTSGETEGIQTRLNMIMQMAIMVKYRTGDLVSDLKLTDIRTIAADSLVSVMMDLASRGNVSYMGVLDCRLIDADGKEINRHHGNIAVYRELRRRVDLAYAEGEFREPYHVEVRISPEGRSDVPPEDMIKGNEISYTMDIK